MLFLIAIRFATTALFALLTVSASAQQSGVVGVMLVPWTGGVMVEQVVPGGPAQRAGIVTGDTIVAVDGHPVQGNNIQQAIGLLRGAVGTSVTIDVMSPVGQTRRVNLVRAEMGRPSESPDTARGNAPPRPSRTGPPASDNLSTPPGPSAPVKFVRWVEPAESSFTIDVPRGWTVSGGIRWTGSLDPQRFVQVVSPDGKIRIQIGDPEILPRQVPNSISMMQAGVGEGGIFRTPSGGKALLQRFLSGTEFAKFHVEGRVCPQARWLLERRLEPVERQIESALVPQAAQFGVRIRASTGEAAFFCGSTEGYAIATTVLVDSPTGNGVIQNWAVMSVATLVSNDPRRTLEGRYVLEQMLATEKLDSAWERAFEQRVIAATGSVLSMQNAALSQQLAASRQANETLSRLNHPNPGVKVRPGERKATSVNTTLGTKDVCDAMGRCGKVSTDWESAFIDHSGNVRQGRAGGAPPDNTGVWSPTYVR